MKTSNFLLATFASVAVLSCKEELGLYEEAIRESKERCYEGITFSCAEQSADTYFKGKLKAQH